MGNRSVLVVFDEGIPKASLVLYDVVISGEALNKLIDPGSIYEAAHFAEELSSIALPYGGAVSKSFIYKGYELWWMYYNDLYLYFCLPYTRYKRLLEYLKTFKQVYLYEPPYKSLFYYYLEANGSKVDLLNSKKLKSPSFLPFGILVQTILTVLSLPILVAKRSPIFVFIGDKFDTGQDYDFRMKFIYRELRSRNMSFVEIIRSLESWKIVLEHAFVIRRRPVIYSEVIALLGRVFALLFLSNLKAKRRFSWEYFKLEMPDKKFKFMIAAHHLRNAYDDIWAIRIMRLILKVIGIKAAYITAATERNMCAFLASKLNNIPTVGILHGVASKYYNNYDFLPGFDGEKNLSVDKYGLWSNWWREYYIQNSRAYRPEQLYISGPMRPLERQLGNNKLQTINTGPVKVLFVSEQLAVPEEILPYLEVLMEDDDISVYLSFRPYRDNFENWLRVHCPQILDKFGEDRIIRTGIKDALTKCEAAVGTMSTAVIEVLFQEKIPILFFTKKWGDYFSLKEYRQSKFFVETPQALVAKVKQVRSIPKETLGDLCKRYFGDPYRNGSAWVVDQLENFTRQ